MEITKEHKFITEIKGTSPAKGYQGVLEGYIEGEIDKGLLTFADQNKKRSQTIDQMIIDILSLFHRDPNGYPVIGSWMVRKCMMDTGVAIFNAAKDKSHPKRSLIPMAIRLIEPLYISLHNGKLIKKPDYVDTYAVTIRNNGKPRSFFKAYESIGIGCTATCTYHFDEDLVSKELAEYWIEKSGLVGWGAFRERFGKFKIVK
jgi:hypothetical protein